jgi:micrococcal nuclease
MYTYSAELLKVIDGDTIEVDFDLGFGVWLRNQRIRLTGIDTPESRTSNKEEKVRGDLSKAKLKEILFVGKRIVITTSIDPNEKYGRILGTITNEQGVNVNKWLIENNYAVVYTGQNKDLVQEAHQKNAVILKARGEI